MKKQFYFLLFLISQFSWAQHNFGIDKDLVESEKKAFLAKKFIKSCSASSGYDVKHYRCNWNVDPAVNAISGSVTMDFVSLIAQSYLEMDLSVSLTVDSILYHNASISFVQINGDILQITFPSSISAGVADSLTVFYHGVPPNSGLGAFAQDSHNGVPVIWTLSEPYGSSDWWPSKNTLTDKADSIDVYLNVPVGNKGASNGLLKQIIPNGSNNIYHWKHRYPIAAYLVCLAVTNYDEFTDTARLQSGNVPVLYYIYPENNVSAHATDSVLMDVMHYYDSLFVPYPFSSEKYGHAQFSWGGGQEHQTMTFVGGFSFGLLSHELAHHWFGDKITCGSWQDIWLNEGFATYCEAISENRIYGPGAFRAWKEYLQSNITSKPDGSVFVTDTTSISRMFSGRLTYNKGAYVLHMLRWKLGDNNFFQALRNYQNDPTVAYSFARTSILKQHLETTSGKNLTNFFDQWFYGEGYPSYLTIWSQDKNNRLKVTLEQTTSHSSVSFFEMPVAVRFKGAGGDTVLVFDHTSSGQTFFTDLNFKVDSIVFDPDLNILSAGNKIMREDVYLRSLQSLVIYPNPASEQINIEVNSLKNYPQKVEFCNVLGQKLMEILPHENKFSINVVDFMEGAYILKVVSGDKATMHKIIISRH